MPQLEAATSALASLPKKHRTKAESGIIFGSNEQISTNNTATFALATRPLTSSKPIKAKKQKLVV